MVTSHQHSQISIGTFKSYNNCNNITMKLLIAVITSLFALCLGEGVNIEDGERRIDMKTSISVIQEANTVTPVLMKRSLTKVGENICDRGGRITRLSLVYENTAATSTFQGNKVTCVDADYPTSATLTINGVLKMEVSLLYLIEFGGFITEKTVFDISGWGKCHIDTSCTVPLVIGDKIGPFLVLDGDTSGTTQTSTPIRKPNQKPTKAPVRRPTRAPTVRRPTKVPVKPLGKNICTGTGNLISLTLQYDLPSATSKIQGNKTTCVKSNYPETGTLNYYVTEIPIVSGTKITISGGPTMRDRTEFQIYDWGTCYIDMSCSVPVRVGDKIGPFLVLSGESR
jgi:hypothetical protein